MQKRRGGATVSTIGRNIGLWTLAILSVGLGLASLRYLAPQPVGAPDIVTANAFADPWLMVHAGLSSVALLVGPFQFWTTKGGQRRAWHRWAGRIYAVCCLLSAPVGLTLAFGASTGPISTAGFGSLAVIWFICTALGWKAALDGRFEQHRRWMIRSYALTFGAVTLRLYLPIGPMIAGNFEDAYRAISFISWVPNLLVAEWILRRRPTRPSRSREEGRAAA